MFKKWLIAFGVMASLGIGVSAGGEPNAPPSGKLDFARDVRPILANHCWACHGPDESSRAGGVRLDRRDTALAPLKNGKRAIVPGKTDVSEMVVRINHEKSSRRMPPPEFKKQITDAQRQVLKRWIAEGAEYAEHWAFVAPKRPELPRIKNAAWPINPIDRFILHRLEEEGLAPSPAANKETLLRRVALDLTGLPPTLAELDAYLKDDSPDAYEKAVDRLLASPRYAEKMAIGWLDAARYADTNGYNNDEERTMWPWRDWVINAFHKNMPFDRFLVEQLAGDLLPDPTLEQKIATGFNRNHVFTTEGGIFEEEYRTEYVADRVHTTATVFLGMSMQCARCHDHKYDPIAQKEYYEFFAFFNNVSDKIFGYNAKNIGAPFVKYAPPETFAALVSLDERLAECDRQIVKRAADAPERAALGEAQLIAENRHTFDAEFRRLQRERGELASKRAALEKSMVPTMIMQELPKRRDTFLLKRGQYDQRGDKVAPGVPGIFPPLPPNDPANRLTLARWLVQPSHPLTARVTVNRWWASYFGAGIVETVEDLGLQGELPSHPELLDWLATELIRTGWDVKAMQKLIVTSATYRQSSKVTPELSAKDPKNRLLARSPRSRLAAETVRDNALAISGLLKEKIGGPSVKPYQPPGLWEEVSVERRYKYVPDKGDDYYRRGMYTFWRRTCPPPGMTTFDAPDRETCVARRARTNTPLQALILLNDPTYVEAARVLAERMIKAGTSDDVRLNYAFRLAVSREATTDERRILTRLLNDSLKRFRDDPGAAQKLLTAGASPRDPSINDAELAAWTSVASTILNMDETISRP